MRALILSDHPLLTLQVRQGLSSLGYDCPADQAVGLAHAGRLDLTGTDLVVVVLSPYVEEALAVLLDVRTLTSARILVVGPGTDARLILRTLRSGADEYLNEAELDAELPAALQGRKSGQFTLPPSGQVVGLLSPSGGSGASTVAVNLAAVLAREHKSALLIDLNLHTGDLAPLLDLKPTHTLADLCQYSDRLDRVLFQRTVVAHAAGAQLLAAPRTREDIVYVTPEGVRQAVTLARALYPHVLLDLDRALGEEQLAALRQADQVLVLLRLDFTALRNTRRMLEHLANLGIAGDRVRVVVNRQGQAKEVPVAKAEDALGVKVSHCLPDDPRTINRANNNGTPAVLESPSARICRSLAKLAANLAAAPPSAGIPALVSV